MSKSLGRSPLNCSVNWYRYRLPNIAETFCGASLRLVKGFSNGFVISPFSNPQAGMLTIPNDFKPDESDLTPEKSILTPSTTKEEYLLEVSSIIGNLDGRQGKTVAARAFRINQAVDIISTFNALCAAYDDAFVFAFSSSETGTWLGASPELLLKVDGVKISTMALAGTRGAFSTDNWDDKNIEEQQLVTDFIKKCLDESCCNVKISPTFTKRAGAVEHLCTPINAELLRHGTDINTEVSDLLAVLSPTPAVCGSDREESLRLISELEKFPREMYGGFCGPNHINGQSAFYVILRCAKCTPDAVCIYSGGGILATSDPVSEWTETELKSKTIINKLISLQNEI